MSAWIVSKQHIDVIVAAVETHGEWSLSRTALGRLLWAENLASVAYRYPNDGDGQRPGPNNFRDNDVNTYKFRAPSAGRLLPGAALKLTESYRYQSSEHPEWADSAAQHLTNALIATLVAAGANKTAEYEDAPWEV